ncbi:extracellular solute-binding protein [Paenarthrobacter sp. NPDC056912]|uniref:extracellular solute-binding protein n=1 Tax=Paenarthrobacter sp. NPDC056912 TaxID=3345965 RepID=UPI003671F573
MISKLRAPKRHIAVVAGVLSLSFAMAGCSSGNGDSSSGGGNVVVSSYGGSFQQAQQTALFNPFSEKSGVTVKATEGTGFDPLKAQEEAGDVTWDVVSLEGAPFANAVKSGLLEPLDFGKIKTEGIAPDVVNDHGVGYIQFSTNLVWDKSKIASMTPKDFFDPSIKLPRSLPDVPERTLEFALMGDGVAPEDMYPLDVDRAFKVLDRIKDQVVGFKGPSDSQSLMQQGDVAVSFQSAGRAEDAIKAGANWGYAWDGAVRDTEYWAIAKGAKNAAAAQDFIAYAVQPDSQAALAKAIPYGPTNTNAYANLSADVNAKLPSFPENAKKGVTLDTAWWVDNSTDVKKRWDSWLLQ